MLERGKLHTEGGKLVIYVQHYEPSDPKQHQNWLPAPKGGFCFTALDRRQLRRAVHRVGGLNRNGFYFRVRAIQSTTIPGRKESKPMLC